MTTILEAIQRVQSQYSKGVQSRDSRLTSRHIYKALMSSRSTLLRDQDTRNQEIGIWSYQTLPCVELEKVTVKGCTVLRSKLQLPSFIQGMGRSLVKSVTTLDGSIRFDRDEFENLKYNVGLKYTSNKPSYYLSPEGFIFISSMTLLRAIPVVALFNDPIEAYMFPSYCNTDCPECSCVDFREKPFPFDDNLMTPLMQLASKELIEMFKQMKEDKFQNASDDTDLSGAMVHNNNGN
jgi:hypothetical protein